MIYLAGAYLLVHASYSVVGLLRKDSNFMAWLPANHRFPIEGPEKQTLEVGPEWPLIAPNSL